MDRRQKTYIAGAHAEDEFEGGIVIDLSKIVRALAKRLTLLVLAFLIGAGAAFGYTVTKVAPTYRASATVFINSGTSAIGTTTASASQLSLSSALASRYISILTSRKVVNAVIEKANLPYSYAYVASMISAKDINSTGILSITVTNTDPIQAEIIANTIVDVLPEAFSDIIEGTSVSVVDYAVIPTSKSGPNILGNTMKGGILLCALAAAIVVILTLLDDTVKTVDDLTSSFNLPILAMIPDQTSKSKGDAYYGYYSKTESKGKKKKSAKAKKGEK